MQVYNHDFRQLNEEGEMKIRPRPERDVIRSITQYLRLWGWDVYRINNAGVWNAKARHGKGAWIFHGTPGVSDLIAIKNDRMIFIECKSEHGKVSPEQQEFLDKISNVKHVQGCIARRIEDVPTRGD